MEISEEAWDEAEGWTAYLQYRRFGRDGFVLRVARCVTPASMIGVEHLFARFSLGRSGDGAGQAESWVVAFDATDRWTVIPSTAPPPRALDRLRFPVTATAEDDDCVEDNSQDNPADCPG